MMSRVSLLDKLKILSDVTSSSGLFAVAILFFVVLAFLFIATSRKAKKISKISCIIIYSAIIAVTIIFYREELFQLFDYMMNNFFIAFYFPNLAIYFAAIIATNIILCVSIFNKNITKWIRTINTIIFCIIHYLLILIINIINENELNIFESTSIYQDQNAQALIELSSTIFIIWILFLIVYKIIRTYQKKHEVVEEQVVEERPTILQEPAPIPIVKTETIIKRKLPDSIRKTEVPSIIYGNVRTKQKEEKQQENIVDFMKSTTPNIINDNSYLTDIPDPILDDSPQFLDVMLRDQEIMKPQKPMKQPKQVVKQVVVEKAKKPKNIMIIEEPKMVERNMPKKVEKEAIPARKDIDLDIFDGLLTLDDYKRVLEILKTYQKKEQVQPKEELKTVNEPMRLDDLSDLYHRNK